MEMNCPMLPTSDNLILDPEPSEERVGTLVIIETKPTYRGIVLAIGPDVVGISVGDRVQYRPFCGVRVSVDGTDYLLVNEGECVCRL